MDRDFPQEPWRTPAPPLAEDPLARGAREVVARLRAAGHEALLAGGCVRDLLLGRPIADYDIATGARPEEVQALFARTVPVGIQFGVVIVLLDDPEDGAPRSYEVATFRTDGPYLDGRHPSRVRFTTPREDALRRDFTINGMFLDPVAGEVIDYVEGRGDLKQGVVAAIGDPAARFEEDKLRMLRAVRFSARLGFPIARPTRAAIRALAPKIRQVSPERIREELVKILTEGGARRGFEMMDALGLLHEILPEIAAMKGVEQPPEFHPEGDVWVHTLMLLEKLDAGASPELALGALLHDVGKPPTFRVAERIRFDGHVEVGVEMTGDILRRLRFPNDTRDRVKDLVGAHMVFADVQKMRPATLKRFLRRPHFDEHLRLHWIDCMSSHERLDAYRFCEEKLGEFEAQDAEEALRPKPLLTGKDLIDMGYTPGPRFKEILSAIEDEQLEGRLATREEAEAFARARFSVP